MRELLKSTIYELNDPSVLKLPLHTAPSADYLHLKNSGFTSYHKLHYNGRNQITLDASMSHWTWLLYRVTFNAITKEQQKANHLNPNGCQSVI